jgi:hypothetical protein
MHVSKSVNVIQGREMTEVLLEGHSPNSRKVLSNVSTPVSKSCV